ncbi:hypothetical protein RI367_000441 [Sorochytrium milnesiophthora]
MASSAWYKLASQNVRELRVHFCQSSPASQHLRNYITRVYPALKSANPELPILIREASGCEPRVFARYDYGVERKVLLNGLEEASIDSKLKELVSSVPAEVAQRAQRRAV